MLQSKKASRRRRAILVLALGAVIATAGIVLVQSMAPTAVVRSPFDAPAAAQRLVYAVELETTLSNGEQDVAHLSLQGDWQVEGATHGTKSLAVTRFDEVSLTSKLADTDQAKLMSTAAEKLEYPMAFAVDASGALREVRESAEMPPEIAHLAKSLPAYAQFVRPEQSASRWTTHEQDPSGDYDASYEEVDAGVVVKKKVVYTRLLAASDGVLKGATRMNVDSSSATYRFDESGTLTQLELTEKLTANTDLAGSMTSTTRLLLKLKRTERGGASDDALKGLLLGHLQKMMKNRSSLAADQARAGGRELGELLDTIEKLPPYAERNEEQKEQERQAFVSLAAKLRLDDGAVSLVLERIRKGARNGRDLSAALGSAGTPKAQEALRAIIDMPDGTVEDRMSQMISLSMVDRPTSETIDFLHDKFDDPEQGRQARFGVGTAVYRLKDVAPEEADRAFAMLESELEQASDPNTTADLLAGIGNSGHPEATAVAEPYLHDEDGNIRAAAVQGIRLAPGDEVDQTLASVLRKDSDPSVRLSAIDAMSDRDPSQVGLTALVETAEDDPKEYVRKEATKLLARFASGSDEVKNALAQYQAEKPSTGG